MYPVRVSRVTPTPANRRRRGKPYRSYLIWKSSLNVTRLVMCAYGYSSIPCRKQAPTSPVCGSVRPPAPQELLLLVFLRVLVCENRLSLVHVMHSGAGVASLVYFTRAIYKRLLKSPLVFKKKLVMIQIQ